jgi:hypothetical protein
MPRAHNLQSSRSITMTQGYRNALSNEEKKQILQYLEGSRADLIQLAWTEKQWSFSHGEGGRTTTKKKPFYIGNMIDSNNEYITCIMQGAKSKKSQPRQIGITRHNWGSTCPSPDQVLEFYKKWLADTHDGEGNESLVE